MENRRREDVKSVGETTLRKNFRILNVNRTDEFIMRSDREVSLSLAE